VVPAEALMSEAMSVAATIASMSLPALRLIKETINRAQEGSLAEGVRFERRTFHGLFGSHDQIEGMTAFLEKRPPNFAHR
jgi:enoyl-CoA hydratase